MIDRFSMQNAYACMPALNALANDAAVRSLLVSAIGKRPTPPSEVMGSCLHADMVLASAADSSGGQFAASSDAGAAHGSGGPSGESATAHVNWPSSPPSSRTQWTDVFRLYAAFQPAPDGSGWRTVRDVCKLHPAAAAHVDMRVLVHTGLLNGLLRRVHAEPVCASLPEPPPLADTEVGSTAHETNGATPSATPAAALAANLAVKVEGRTEQFTQQQQQLQVLPADGSGAGWRVHGGASRGNGSAASGGLDRRQQVRMMLEGAYGTHPGMEGGLGGSKSEELSHHGKAEAQRTR